MVKTRVNVMGTLRAMKVEDSIYLSSEVVSETSLRATAGALKRCGTYRVSKEGSRFHIKRTK